MSAGFSSDMDKENLAFTHHFPYDFASPYSTKSESDDEDLAALTRRFSRSASLKEPLYSLKEKRVFSGSVPCHAPSFVKGDEDAWNINMIYHAAGQVARMKMGMSGLHEPQRAFARYRNRCVASGESVGGYSGFPQSAWPPPQLQNQQFHQHRADEHKPCNARVMKPVVRIGSGAGGATPARKECPGTGVFLPRRYCSNPPESRKRQACSPANLPARTIQYSSNNLVHITGQPQAQARINVSLVPHYEMLMGRRNAMIQAVQQLRSNIHGGVMESPVNNPEMLLPQEWTY